MYFTTEERKARRDSFKLQVSVHFFLRSNVSFRKAFVSEK